MNITKVKMHKVAVFTTAGVLSPTFLTTVEYKGVAHTVHTISAGIALLTIAVDMGSEKALPNPNII